MNQQMCVLLVVGGDSSERDVSLDTGKNVFSALRALGHRVFVADPLRPEIKPTENPTVIFDETAIGAEPPTFERDRYRARQVFVQVLAHHTNLSCDIVFNGLHGGAGEDGTIQAVLDYLGVRYTGSGASACAVAMNKDLSKRIVAHASVPVIKQLFIDSVPHESMVVDEQILDCLSLPVVVKPNTGGSSVGVTVVQSRGHLAEAIKRAKECGGPYLVESFIPGKEITAAVMDFNELPLLEIQPKLGFYDYKNKYQSGSCDYLVPAPLDEKTTSAITKSALASYRALGLKGYARIDFRVHENGQHYFLEANTLPGLTANSLFPKAARAAGISYNETISSILRLATLD